MARLVPITDDPWRDLIAAGEVVPASRATDVRDLEPHDYGFSAFGGSAATAFRRTVAPVRLYPYTSALVKLLVAEDESAQLGAYLRGFADDVFFSAALARTELVRTGAGGGQAAVTHARILLDSIDTVTLTRSLLDDAATLAPPRLRTLDAIHLVAALRAGTSLRAVVTHGRMAHAAAVLGIPTVSPA